MTRQLLLGATAALLIAAPASALTMTPTTDGRYTNVNAQVSGVPLDSDNDSPSAGFPAFVSEVSAHASQDISGAFGDANSQHGYGAWADANARQSSEIGALSISGEGSANASGSHGDFRDLLNLGDADLGFGGFQADADSTLRIIFNIDEAAAFNIQGFIASGIEQAVGNVESDIENYTYVSLHNEDTDSTVYEEEVFDDVLKFNKDGVIAAGNYTFTITARSEVFSNGILATLGDSDAAQDDFVYATSGKYGGTLSLKAVDQPIPEPVTTSLIGMSLGALVLRTSRRRRA